MAKLETYKRKPERITVVQLPGGDPNTRTVLDINGEDPPKVKMNISLEVLQRDYVLLKKPPRKITNNELDKKEDAGT